MTWNEEREARLEAEHAQGLTIAETDPVEIVHSDPVDLWRRAVAMATVANLAELSDRAVDLWTRGESGRWDEMAMGARQAANLLRKIQEAIAVLNPPEPASREPEGLMDEVLGGRR